MRRVAFIFGLVFSLAVVGAGQVRIVTNSTLERFQQKRLAAEKDYRENYQRMGFPSPDELARQREADMAARVELAAQLRKARLEKERLELEQRNLEFEAARMNNEIDDSRYRYDGPYGRYNGPYGGYVGGYSGFYSNGRFWRHRGHGGFFPNDRTDGGYRVTPFGVFPTDGTIPQRFFSRGFRSGGAIIHITHPHH